MAYGLTRNSIAGGVRCEPVFGWISTELSCTDAETRSVRNDQIAVLVQESSHALLAHNEAEPDVDRARVLSPEYLLLIRVISLKASSPKTRRSMVSSLGCSQPS